MALADIVQEAQKPHSETYTSQSRQGLTSIFQSLQDQVQSGILDQGISQDRIYYERYLNMRYQGTETSMMILESDASDFKEEFLKRHLQEFNFIFPEDRPILLDDVRVRGIRKSDATANDGDRLSTELGSLSFEPSKTIPDTKVGLLTILEDMSNELQKLVYFKGHGDLSTPIYVLSSLKAGSLIQGPAIIIDATQTLVIVPEAQAKILSSHVVVELTSGSKQTVSHQVVDAATLSVFGHRFMSIAEQMVRALQNTSVSLNIKERLDFSCALFGPDGMSTTSVYASSSDKIQPAL